MNDRNSSYSAQSLRNHTCILKSRTIQLEMVPFPEPGAPTIRAQILPPLDEVEEFLLDDEAFEVGETHEKIPLQMGGRRTKDDNMAKKRGTGTC